MNEAWIGLIGALGGVAVTGTFGLVVAVLKRHWDASAEAKQRGHQLGEARAESRRLAYIRFLNAADALGDHVLVQPPHADGGAKDFEKATKRIRELQSSGNLCFTVYGAALLEAKLLADTQVLQELDAFDEWVTQQLVISVREADAATTHAFFDTSEKRRPLLDAMRKEQAADLAA